MGSRKGFPRIPENVDDKLSDAVYAIGADRVD
jgi:hypothetical protein